MRGRLFQLLLILLPLSSISQKIQPFAEVGVNYRQYPIDLEDVIIYYPEQGGFCGPKLWQTWSLVNRIGIAAKHNLQFSVEADVRHNLFHWVKGEHYSYNSSGFPRKDREFVRNFKYDLFLNAEKKFRLDNRKENFLFVLAGIGYTNLNTGYDLILQDTLDNNAMAPVHYKGSLKHFSPRFSIGCQIWRFRSSIDGYIIEDPELRNLTSLWLGGTVGYEFWPTKKKRQTKS